ncbi:MAG: riboflavin synthase [Stellaceae bacterium]
MFTGIVSDVGEVRQIIQRGDTGFRIGTRYDCAEIAIGASISCAGVCLSVVEKGPDWFGVTASAETLARSTLGAWRKGTRINLERALKSGDEMGGHVVMGHVDAVAIVVERRPEGDSVRFSFEVPAGYETTLAPKGSVALDGVSLTVNEVRGSRFGVNIIPHTLEVTTFGSLASGQRVNLEIDVIARYIARILGKPLA